MANQSMYNKAFWNTMRIQHEVYPEMSNMADSTGSYPAPYEFLSSYTPALEKENLFRRIGTVIKTTSPEGKIHAATSTGKAEWVGEAVAIPESSDTISQFTVDSHKLASLAKLKHTFVTDNKFDIEKYLKNEFARRFGREEENALINGDGNDAPVGILHPTAGAEVGITTATDAITYDEIIKLYFSLDKHYRKNAVWVVNDETALYLRTLKDASGNYIWNHTDNTILGKPVEYSPYMPEIESGKKPIAFGDFSYLWLIERQPLSIKVLKEKYILEGQIGYAAYERLDAKLIVPEAVKLLQVAE
ncbi:phage major capsid protein [Heliorestis convoluta]|uniref:Phage major capsid protein, HK97 family n=1 Tax=Heliorestis convoluta TaxID=356322 RepID=A0A5Q2N292_9FIRM|nr:phage major capsid protein [Heliorestis convoluta]QGG47402.1 phage major capsid protein, HK97 family [Heliorestis convoluta]